MADTLTTAGSITTTPTTGPQSGIVSFAMPLDEQVVLKSKEAGVYTLASDAPVTVSFGGVANANVVFVRGYGGKLKLTLTSADGATQIVPVDPIGYLRSDKVPYTALTLTRDIGVQVVAHVLLGEKA